MKDKITVHKYQKMLIDSRYRFTLGLAGWQGGKSVGGALALATRIDEDTKVWYEEGKRRDEKPKYWIVAPTEEILVQYSMAKFMDYLPEDSFHFSKTTKTIKIKDSEVLIIGKSANRSSSIEAATLNGIWADEAGLYSREVWNKLRPRINVRGGFIIFTTTPYALSWIYDEIYLKWLEGNPDFNVVQWRSIDNPYFSKEEYYKEKERLSTEEFEMKYGGQFTRLTGMVYEFDRVKHTVPYRQIPTVYDVTLVGIDFGMAKPCGISVIGIKDGVYYVIDEFKRAHVEWSDLAEKLFFFKSKYGISYMYADPEDPKAIADLRVRGLEVVKADNDVQARLRKVRNLMNSKNFFISDHCTDHIKEIQSYGRQIDQDGLYSEKPAKRNDHLMDAMGYAIYTHNYSSIDKLHIVHINLTDLTRHVPLVQADLSSFFTPKGREDMYKEIYGDESLDSFYSMQTYERDDFF